MVRIPPPVIGGCLAGLILVVPGPAPPQTAGQTKSIQGRVSDAYWTDVPLLTDTFTHDGVGEGINSFGRACKDQAAAYDAMRKATLTAASRPGLSKEMRDKGQKLAKDIEHLKNTNTKAATWSQKLGKFLDTINVVSTFAKAAGYAYEGDRTGAVGVIVDEGVKKVTTGILGAAGSVVPGVGSMAGATLGEYVHETHTRPILEGQVDAVRTKAAMDKHLGANVPREQVMSWDGSVRTLPADMYVDRETGNVRQRSPEEQRRYEDDFRRGLREAAKSDHPLDTAQRELGEGKITQAEFDKKVAEHNDPNRDRRRTHKDRGPAAKEVEEGAEREEGDTEAAREESDADEDSAEERDADEDSDEAEEEESPARGPKPSKNILEHVAPVRVTAVGRYAEDWSAQKIRNIVTFTVTLTFWNVGALAPGYADATLRWTAVASLNGSEDSGACSGSFSGGPNGTFKLRCEGGGRTLRLSNGQSVGFESTSLKVQNPGAFDKWP